MFKINVDQHCHTNLSPDNVGPFLDVNADNEPTITNYMYEAQIKGLSEITFTDHLDFYNGVKDSKYETINMNSAYDNYLMREPILTANYGVELGLRPECETEIKEALKRQKFDIIIGSQHITNSMDISIDKNFYEGLSNPEIFSDESKKYACIEKTIKKYFEEEITNIELYHNDIDVIGHLDYISRYLIKYYKLDKNFVICKTKYSDYDKIEPLIEKIFDLIIKYNKALEINTSGLRYGLGTTHPNPELIARFKDKGGRLITFGSDAHRIEHIGYGFDKAAEIALNCGFDEYAVYKNREPQLRKIKEKY